ncbi:MAG TPA: sialidase family protein [Tepidisphaeraceae bacterium]|nr:sialidase family protein [Tepidisphaeraceae bacterium]
MAKMGHVAYLAAVFLTAVARTAGAADPAVAVPPAKVESVVKIWDQAKHNAFTDLIRHTDGTWLCTFREGSAHIPGIDGTIRVIASKEGGKWESRALLAEQGVDLRDSKICHTPDGRLMLVMGGSYYDGAEPTPNRKRTGMHTRVAFSSDGGTTWTPPAKIEGVPDNVWLWRVTWHKGVGYGTVYGIARDAKGNREFAVYRTTDGLKYADPIDTKVPASGGEATIRFMPDDTMHVLFRGEGKTRSAFIGTSKAPYADWNWKDAGRAAQGPNFIRLADGRLVYAGRDFDPKAKTVLGVMTAETLAPLVTLPSGGDTSYPGLVEAEPNLVWMSYYSSHEGKSAIYLAKVRIAK